MKRIFLSTIAALLLSLGCAAAEPTETEQRIRQDAQKHPQSSVVFMDVKALEEGKDRFCETSVTVASDQGYGTIFFTRKASGFFGHPDSGAIAFLPPGTYTIFSVQCKFTARLNGKFARFRVGPNEIINAGSLVIDFTKGPITFFEPRTFNGRTSVEDLGAKEIESITERAPTIFPKATKRYMTPNPATSGKQPS